MNDCGENLEVQLARRLTMPELKSLAADAAGDPALRGRLLEMALGATSLRVGRNALWCLTHIKDNCADWVHEVRDLIIDRLLVEPDTARRRMLLQLLRGCRFEASDVRGDLLDFCLSKINDESEPYAIRAFSLYVAAKLCRNFPELVGELRGYVEILGSQSLSPGLKCALRKVKKEFGYD